MPNPALAFTSYHATWPGRGTEGFTRHLEKKKPSVCICHSQVYKAFHVPPQHYNLLTAHYYYSSDVYFVFLGQICFDQSYQRAVTQLSDPVYPSTASTSRSPHPSCHIPGSLRIKVHVPSAFEPASQEHPGMKEWDKIRAKGEIILSYYID